MASTLIVSLSSSSSLVKTNKSTIYSSFSCSKTFNFNHFSPFSQLGISHFSPWNGLKHVGISISPKPLMIGKGKKCRGKVVYASLFGVGAPEALVIGVVALLVFGPKGLAEVARNLGKTLRAFQPTIKELQEVSREFKNTLEREISLDDDPTETKNTSVSNTTNPTSTSSISSSEESQTVPTAEEPQTVSMAEPNGAAPSKAYSSVDYLKITEEQLTARQEALSSSPESQVEPESEPQASAALQQDAVPSSPETQIESESQTLAVQQDVASSPPERTIEPESQPQAVQETANATTSVQKSENDL